MCAATVRDVAVKVAWPELNVAVPRVVVPSLKVTVPLGVPLAGAAGLTVAVKVTGWPKIVVVADEARAVVLLAWLTDWINAEEVLELKLPSP